MSELTIQYLGEDYRISIKWFFSVTNLQEMLETLNVKNSAHSLAYTSTYGKEDPLWAGTMYLATGSDIELIAHEAVHMASGIIARHNKQDINLRLTTAHATDLEEDLGDLVGAITSGLIELPEALTNPTTPNVSAQSLPPLPDSKPAKSNACSFCNGKGTVQAATRRIKAHEVECPICEGTGYSPEVRSAGESEFKQDYELNGILTNFYMAVRRSHEKLSDDEPFETAIKAIREAISNTTAPQSAKGNAATSRSRDLLNTNSIYCDCPPGTIKKYAHRHYPRPTPTPKTKSCPNCKGSGRYKNKVGIWPCIRCRGKGEVTE